MMKTKKNEMPLKHETFKGTFTDYRGMSRDFTMVAVSIPVKEDMGVYRTYPLIDPEDDCMKVYTYDADFCKLENKYPVVTQSSTIEPTIEYSEVGTVRKMLAIGVTVRCVRDKDLGISESVAYGKALRDAYNGKGHVMYVSHGGMINTKMVRALLEQEAEHFSKDPGSYLKGYNNDRDRYLKTGYIGDIELTWDEFGERYPIEKAKKAENLKPEKKIVINQTTAKTQPKYSPETVLNEVEKQEPTPVEPTPTETTFGSAPTSYDVNPSEGEDNNKKTLSPAQQRLHRFGKLD